MFKVYNFLVSPIHPPLGDFHEARKLSIACDGAIPMLFQVQTSLKEHGVELQELHLAMSEVCGHLAPPPLAQVPLIDQLWALLGHVEHAVFDGAFHRGSLALGQMVSHFNKINVGVIVEGYATGQSDEDLDNIEEQVSPHARSLANRVDVKMLLRGPSSP